MMPYLVIVINPIFDFLIELANDPICDSFPYTK